jgi:DNAJ protein RME-8 N-terminal
MPALSQMEEEQLDELERDTLEVNISENAGGPPCSRATVEEARQSSEQAAAASTNTARLRRIKLAVARSINGGTKASNENFRIFFHVLTKDPSMADLIWPQQTRRELQVALEGEMQCFVREKEAKGVDAIAWHHQQLCVRYPSLNSEVKVGSVYMRLWLQAGDGFVKRWDQPLQLFELLFRRLMCEIYRDEKVREGQLCDAC